MSRLCNIDVMGEVPEAQTGKCKAEGSNPSFIQRGWANETFASTEFHAISG